MLRLLLVVVVSVGMARLGFCFVTDSIQDDAQSVEMRMTQARIEIGWQNLELFRTAMNQTLAELADEDLTLAQAVERIESMAQRHEPMYLRSLQIRRGGATIKERIAHNIVGHFVSQIQENDGSDEQLNEVLCRLKLEMARMFSPRPRS